MKAINYPSWQHAYCMLSICKGVFQACRHVGTTPQAGAPFQKTNEGAASLWFYRGWKVWVRMVFPWDLPSLKLGAVLVCVTVVNLCGAVSAGLLESHGENHVSDSPFQDTLPKTNGFPQKIAVSDRNL